MEVFSKMLNWYATLPAALMIMMGIFLVGLLLARLNPLRALKSAIYVAAGIIGLNTFSRECCQQKRVV